MSKHGDEHIRKIMDGFAPEPSPAVWDRIEAELDEDKRRRPFWWIFTSLNGWLWIFLAASVAGLVGYITTSETQHERPVSALAKNEVANRSHGQKTGSVIDKIQFPDSAMNNHKDSVNAPYDHIIQNEKPNDLQKEITPAIAGNPEKTAKIAEKKERRRQQHISPGKTENAGSETISQQTRKKEKEQSHQQENNKVQKEETIMQPANIITLQKPDTAVFVLRDDQGIKDSVMEAGSAEEVNLFEKDTLASKDTVTIPDVAQNRKDSLISKDSVEASLNSPPQKKDTLKRKKFIPPTGFYIGAGAGKFSPKTTFHSDNAALTANFAAPTVTIPISLVTGYDSKKGWTLTAGVQYFSLAQQSTPGLVRFHKMHPPSEIVIPTVFGDLHYAPTDFSKQDDAINPVLGDTIHLKPRITQQITYVQIPLAAGWNISIGRLLVKPAIGATALYTVKTHTTVVMADAPSGKTFENTQKTGMKTLNLRVFGGLTLRFYASRHFFAEATGQYMTGGSMVSGATYKTNFVLGGAALGYHF